MGEMIDYLEMARSVLKLEAKALESASQKLNNEVISKLVLIFNDLIGSKGNLFFCGVGKSGNIASKLASTFSSIGLPSFSLHPIDALHGDLGKIRISDVVVVISKSGTTEEILKLIPYLPVPRKKMIGLLGNINSPLSSKCGLVFDCSVEREACINNQAPTTSTILTLGMGHVMAVMFQSLIGISKEFFASFHPSGLLGKSLRIKVQDLMIRPLDCPILDPEETLQDSIVKMCQFPIGGAAVLDKNQLLLGIIVEGDIRRAFNKWEKDALTKKLNQIMNINPISVHPHDLALSALQIMENREHLINILPVVLEKRFLGFVRIHDLLKEGLILDNSLKKTEIEEQENQKSKIKKIFNSPVSPNF